MTKETFLSEVKNTVLSFDHDARIILFGSRARGDSKQDSDWDILILTSSPFNEERKIEIQKRLYETELEAEEVISTLIHSQEEWDDLAITSFHQIVQEEGVEI